MIQISSLLTEKNIKKIKEHKIKLQKTNIGKISFSTALNDLLEKIQ